MRISLIGPAEMAARFLRLLGKEAHEIEWTSYSKKKNKHVLLGLDNHTTAILNSEEIQSMVVQEEELKMFPNPLLNRFLAFKEWERDRNL